MYCRKCGYQLQDDAKFCPSCGEKVVLVEDEIADGETIANVDENINVDKGLRRYLTENNIERFAPLAAIVPLVMAIVVFVVGKVLLITIGQISIVGKVIEVAMGIVKVLFVVVTTCATLGLVYLGIKRKDKTSFYIWIVLLTTLCATGACVGMAFGWNVFSWITGLISVAMGAEYAARITIAKQPIDSPINPSAAMTTYSRCYKEYKVKYPVTREEPENIKDNSKTSKFDGTGLALLGYRILTLFVTIITLGIGTPWMICKVYKWQIKHTCIDGKRLSFEGKGLSLLGHWILWELLTIITLGIYGFFVHVSLRKWELKHTYIEGTQNAVGEAISSFDGSGLGYLGYKLLGGLFLLFTCGLSYPWVMCMLQKWDTKHQIINKKHLKFDGSGWGFLGEFLIILVLSIITVGIYIPWGTVRLNKYIVRHTSFV